MSNRRSEPRGEKRRTCEPPGEEVDPFEFVGDSDETDGSEVEDDVEDEDLEEEMRPREAINPPDDRPRRRGKDSASALKEAIKKAKDMGFTGGPLGGAAPAPHPPVHNHVQGGPMYPSPARSELEWFHTYLTSDNLDQIVDQTNNYMHQYPKRVSGSPHDTTQEELRAFFTCLLAFSVTDYATFNLAWERKDHTGLFGNAFLQSLMSFTRFKTLYRCINADTVAWTRHFNLVNSQVWRLSDHVDFDDDLDRFMGRPGAEGVKYVPKKKAKRGIATWRIVDLHKFCYFLLWEAEFAALGQGLLSARIMRELLARMNGARHRTIYLDAGTLGGWESVELLLKERHSFIISHAANRPTWLFSDLLHTPIHRPRAHDWVSIGNGKVVAVTYAAKKVNRPVKLVNFTTNLPGLTVAAASDGKPSIVEEYNKHKGYVDCLKAEFNEYYIRH